MAQYDDPTESVTDLSAKELDESVDRLTGPLHPHVAPSAHNAKLLVRLHSGVVGPELAQHLQVASYRPSLPSDRMAPPVILGPFTEEEVRGLVADNFVSLNDYVLRSTDRWKTLKNVFPDLGSAFDAPDEVTATATLTATARGTFDDNPDSRVSERSRTPAQNSVEVVGQERDEELEASDENLAPTDEAGADAGHAESDALNFSGELSLEKVGDEVGADAGNESAHESSPHGEQVGTPLPSAASATDARASALQPRNSATGLAQPRAGAGPAAVRATPRHTPRAVQSAARIAGKAPDPQVTPRRSTARRAGFALAGLAAVAGGVYYQRQHLIEAEVQAPVEPVGGLASKASDATAPGAAPRSYPENLRPLAPEALYAADSKIVQKIRPILNSYERGANLLSEGDEQQLRVFADPASSSWEARRLAANQLAVYYLSTQRTEDAKKVLRPINEAQNSDPVTLLNLALIHLVDGELDQARQMADAGLRLAPSSLSWVAYSVRGMIESRDRVDEAEKAFASAAGRSSNNPLIYGMWIQSLFRADPAGKGRIPKLIREALWSDPDRNVDAPIRAPLGGHIIVAEALDGLKKGADWSESKLRPGQLAFSRWLEARNRFNPLSQSLSSVVEQLKGEDEALSKLLLAYGQKEQGRLSDARETMQKLLPSLDREMRNLSSSYPWTFAGDLEAATGHGPEAEALYQTALTRNPQDTAAVLGTALALRARGEYAGAEQKLAEALALDPLFVPALLRVDRFEWQRRYRAK